MSNNRTTFKTTITLPSKLKTDVDRRVIRDGYGFRGKSKWVSEALDEFLNLENFVEYVEMGETSNLDDRMSFAIDINLEGGINEAVIRIRRAYPHLEGIKSRILRTALVQRLVRGGGAD